jgi:hypothetical protein
MKGAKIVWCSVHGGDVLYCARIKPLIKEVELDFHT